MEVRLKREWMGYHVGSIVKVDEHCANILFQKDEAEKMKPESIQQIRKKLQDMAEGNRLKAFPVS